MNSQFWHLRIFQKQSAHPHQNLKDLSKRPSIFVLLLICLATAAFCFSRSYLKNGSPGQTPIAPRQTLLLYDKEQKDSTDLVTLLEQLSDKNEDIREDSRKRIVELGQQSNENRQIIIAELLKRVAVPDFKYQVTTLSVSFFWEEVCEILGRLKAVEAIDFLVDCMNCAAVHQYASNRYRHRPAMGALEAMGQPAVARVARRLSDPDPHVRIYAAVILGNIQGHAARQALSEAFRNETDFDVQTEIKNAIAAIDRGL